MSKPKIMVFRMREQIYTAIFAVLAIALLILVIFMFRPKGESEKPNTSALAETDANVASTEAAAASANAASTATEADAGTYRAGVYTTSLTLGDHAVDVEVAVDNEKIIGIRLVNLGESVTTMLPLVEPALDELETQICQTQSTDGITCSQENKYTSQILFQAIQNALAKARR